MRRGTTLEAMTIADLAQILAIDRRSFPEPRSITAFVHELRNPRAVRLVARRPDGRVEAFAIGWVIADELEVLTVAVALGARRCGIGRRLVHGLIEYGRSAGVQTVRLEVRAGNVGAQRLYVGSGFRRCGRRARYYGGDGEDALLFEHRLCVPDTSQAASLAADQTTEGDGGDRLR